MRQYLDLMERVLADGVEKRDRTGTGTLSVFGHQVRFDLNEGFPLVTTKKLHVKSIIQELLWFLRGETNVRSLNDHGVTIWDDWADADGELGPVYGKQWRSWPKPDGGSIDQRATARRDPPQSRFTVAVVSAWTRPMSSRWRCRRAMVCFILRREGRLSCQLYHAPPYFLGVPFNIASYALLTMRSRIERSPGWRVHIPWVTRIYLNHMEQAHLQLSRPPRALPRLHMNPDVKDLFAFRYEDFTLEGYEPHPHIKAAVAV